MKNFYLKLTKALLMLSLGLFLCLTPAAATMNASAAVQMESANTVAVPVAETEDDGSFFILMGGMLLIILFVVVVAVSTAVCSITVAVVEGDA